MNTKLKPILLASYLILGPVSASAWQDTRSDIVMNCEQNPVSSAIDCQYRTLIDQAEVSLEASLGSQSLAIVNEKPYPGMDSTAAVLFMVDTSDPARQAVVSRNLEQIRQMLEASKPHQLLGLASFDKELHVHAKPGASHQQILTAMESIKATGKTTELYRNLISAIKILANTDSDRKSVYIFSDGLAEDKAYFHGDVVKQATENNVVITSLGFPRSTAQSVSLQRLRRLSEETGGVFTESDSTFSLKPEFMTQPFASINSGGSFSISMDSISVDKINAGDKLQVALNQAGNNVNFNLPIDIPALTQANATLADLDPQKQAQVTTATANNPLPAVADKQTMTATSSTNIQAASSPITIADMPADNNTLSITRTVNQSKPIERWLLYSLPVALVILLFLTVATFLMTIWKPKNRKYPVIETGDLKPYAYLVIQDSTQRRYPITRTNWRIGRSKDNELAYDDNSISRRHCEIHREQGDVFTLLDLNSLNGVFVNNEKVKIHQLKEGDILEIGDVNFRFTLLSSEHSLEEVTSVQQTKIPVTQH